MLNIIAAQLGAISATPAPVGTPYQWFDADDATTFTYSSGVVVSQWADKSGNSRNASQATVANQPTRQTNVVNGKAVVRFDATNDQLTYTEYSLSNRTIFMVFRNAAQLNSGTNVDLINGGTTFPWQIFGFGSQSGGIANEVATWLGVSSGGSTIQGYYSTANIAAGNHQLNWTTNSSYAFAAKLDKSNLSTTAHAGGFSATTYPGNSGGFSGAATGIDLCEYIVYDTVLSGTDITANEDYLATKWGL
jgi:hypothetical protein